MWEIVNTYGKWGTLIAIWILAECLITWMKVYWHKSPDSPHHYLVGEGPVDV